jgi:ABC-type Fe3+-hydroxamate transport system substrate-binding protein
MKKIISKLTIVLIAILTMSVLTACGKVTNVGTEIQETNPKQMDEAITTGSGIQEIVTLDFEKLEELENKNITFIDVYNEVASLAVSNGWDVDSITVDELYNADTFILLNNDVITDPSNMTNEDVLNLIQITEEVTVELDTTLRERVSIPYIATE